MAGGLVFHPSGYSLIVRSLIRPDIEDVYVRVLAVMQPCGHSILSPSFALGARSRSCSLFCWIVIS